MTQRLLPLLKSLFAHKKAVFGVAFLVALFSFFPLHFAQANIFSDIFGVLTNLVTGFVFRWPLLVVTGLLYVGALLAVWLSAALVAALKVFLEASLSIPVLPGEGIAVVTQGWEFSRDLVNIVFLLILVFIGLATILRLQNYNMQRALPLLIIIALLVNFSGVFVAFIVDLSNLVTNALVAQLGTLDMAVGSSVNILKSMGDDIVGVVANITDPFAFLAPPVKALLYLLFHLIFAAVMFIVTLLIIVRVGILWALTILAPIAFASYILPATRNLWNQWLKQLILWSIIGIPITFFLWLAQIAASSADSIQTSFTAGFEFAQPGGVDPGLMDVIASLTGPIVALLFVVIGIMVAMQFAPQGANTVINLAKKGGVKGGLALGSAAMRFRGAPSKRAPRVGIGRFQVGGFKLGLDKTVGETLEERGIALRQRAGIAGMSQDELNTKKADVDKSIDAKEADREAQENRVNEIAQKRGRGETLTQADLLQEREANENIGQIDKEIEDLKEEKGLYENPKKVIGGAGGRLVARWAGKAMELAGGEPTRRLKAKDEREIGEGKSEGTNKDARDNARLINQEFAKGMAANMNRVVGLLDAMVANGDTNDLEQYLREGILSPERVGKAVMAARRGGPPAFRPLMKALGSKMIYDPDQFGPDFATDKDEQGNIQRKADGVTPKFLNDTVQRMFDEIAEKTQPGEITQKIFGDAIDKGKAGGWEFEHGGRQLLDLLTKTRGGDLTGPLIRRPESKEGRAAMMEFYREYDPRDLYRYGAQGVLTYLASTAAQGAGVTSPLSQQETRRLTDALRDLEHGIETIQRRGMDNGRPTQEVIDELSRLWRETGRPDQRPKPAPGTPLPLRTRAELGSEIAQSTARLTNIQNQIPNLRARAAAPNVGTRQYQTLLHQVEELGKEEAQLTQKIDQLNDERKRLPKERALLRDVADNRFASLPAGSPKTQAEVRQEVRTEYEQKYRPSIVGQIKQENPLIRWNAEHAGITRNRAERKRIRQLYDDLRLRDTVPQPTPAPSRVEKKDFEDIARSTSAIPPTTDPQRARKLEGSLHASLQLIGQIEGQVNRLSREIAEVERRHGDASGQRSMRDRYQGQLDSFNRRKDDIRTELGMTP